MYQFRKVAVEAKLEKYMNDLNIVNINDAFMYFIYSIYNNLENEDVDVTDIIKTDDVVDGSQDKQIDIIHIEKNEEQEEAIIRIFQVKKTNGFSPNILIQIKNGLEWILEKPKEELGSNSNKKFVRKIKEVRNLLGEYNLSNIDLQIYYITLGNVNDLIDNNEFNEEYYALKNKYKNEGFRSYEVFILGACEIMDQLNLIEMKDKKIDESIKFIYDVNKPSLIEMESAEFKGVICSVLAKEIADIVSKDKNDILFDKNIRKYLQARGKVNQNIYETCSDEEKSKLFWCLNNGITMICDKFEVNKLSDSPHIYIENMQIINGCQTSVTLFKAMKDGVLSEDAKVLLKIYATSEPSIVDNITIATNNQNPIGVRDLRANDPAQISIQRSLFEKYGYYYERKRNEYKGLPKNEKHKLITNEKIGQAFLAVGLKKPNRALSSKSDVFKQEYDNIFRRSSTEKLLFSYQIYKFVEGKKKESLTNNTDDLKEDIILYGTFHISRIVASLVQNANHFVKDYELNHIIIQLQNGDLDFEMLYDLVVEKLKNDLLEKDIDSIMNYFKRKESSELMNHITISMLSEQV